MVECKQEKHGIPKMKILHVIRQCNVPGENGKKKYATSNRIAKEIGKTTAYVCELLDYYWAQSLIAKKIIKKAREQYLMADGCTFHYILTQTGEREYQRLKGIYGDITPYLKTLHPTDYNFNPQPTIETKLLAPA